MEKKKQIYLGITLVALIMVISFIALAASPTGMFKGGIPGKPSKPSAECSDHIDNDGDGYCDFAWKKAYCDDGSTVGDSGCSAKDDNDETNCGDGVCEGGENSNNCPVDCVIETHKVCSSGYCVEVNGTGTDECISNYDCMNCNDTDWYNIYVKGYCFDAIGNFSDYCDGTEYVAEYYCNANWSECANSTELCPSGFECSDGACVNITTHTECSSGYCVEVSGSGEDQCAADNQCRHKECDGGDCITVMIPGIDECNVDADCTSFWCFDTDGYNPYILGYINSSEGEYTDYCYTNQRVVEYYCSELNSSVMADIVYCYNGSCTNAACEYS
jgi:hypothetical protein